jgi:hypothetical protein
MKLENKKCKIQRAKSKIEGHTAKIHARGFMKKEFNH